MAGVTVTVAGELSDDLREAFDDVETSARRGVTCIHLATDDPSMLHGLLRRVDDLGLELLGVQRDASRD